MKIKYSQWMTALICFTLILATFLPSLASAASSNEPNLHSDAAYLYNLGTNDVLYAKNQDQTFSIHSLVMLMTTYLLIEDINKGKVRLTDNTIVSKKAWKTPGTRMYLEIGKKVSVQNLLEGLTIASGNDAAIATAEFLSGSTDKFVSRMNQEAKKIGMKHTKFYSPNGSLNDISTAKDLFILSKMIIDKYPNYLKYFSQSQMSYDTRPDKTLTLSNQNEFVMEDPNATGLFSGSGDRQYHTVITVNKNGMELIAVTLNTTSSSKRTSDIYNLLNYGYSQYQVINLAKAGDHYSDFSVYQSTTPGPSPVVYKNDLNVVVKVGVTVDQLQKKFVGQGYILGGEKKGTVLGRVQIYNNNRLLKETSIVSTETFKKVRGLSAAIDSIALFFRNIFNMISHH